MYNLIDSPAGVIPATRVDPAKDALTPEFLAVERGTVSPTIHRAMYLPSHYDVEDMKGMPVGVQVIGKRFEDEKVLAMMNVVDEALGERGFGPGSSLGKV